MVTPEALPNDPDDPVLQSRTASDRRLIAPIWHTVVLIVVLVGLALVQALQQPVVETLNLRSRLPLYLSMIGFELTLLGYVWFLGLRARNVPLRDVIGGKWTTIEDVGRDVGIALMFWSIVIGVLFILAKFLGTNPTGIKAVGTLLPQGAAETIVWVILAVTAGFCEEVIFRGYLQRQFFALTGNGEVAIVLQALIFGLAHIYQGVKGALTIAIYGAMFGVLAAKRKSLRPGMIQHSGQDIFSGIVGSILRKRGLL